MPPGLTATLREDEFVDLIRFLAELGKEGTYKVGPNPVVRTWQILQKAGNARLLTGNSLPVLRQVEGLEWKHAYSLVSGQLPVAALPTNRRQDFEFTMASFPLEVSTAGRLTFRINDPAGIQLWIGGKGANLAETFTMDLPKGTHEALVAIATKTRSIPLRLELVPSDQGGQARILGQ
jgi:hypothetical protein